MADKIHLRTIKGDVEMEVVYRNGNIVTHRSTYPVGTQHMTVSNAICGFAYRTGFGTEESAKEFADYLASVPEFANLISNDEAPRVPSEVVQAMKNKFQEIIMAELAKPLKESDNAAG